MTQATSTMACARPRQSYNSGPLSLAAASVCTSTDGPPSSTSSRSLWLARRRTPAAVLEVGAEFGARRGRAAAEGAAVVVGRAPVARQPAFALARVCERMGAVILAGGWVAGPCGSGRST